MATVESRYDETGITGVAGVEELLTDLWFTLATITGVIHLHMAASEFRAALSGDGSFLLATLTFGAVVATAGLLVAYELGMAPHEKIYQVGIGLTALLVLAYIDFTALGIVAPLLGAESPGAREPTLVVGYLYLDLIVEGNILALTSKISEIGLLVTLGTLYGGERDLFSLGNDSHTVRSAAAKADTSDDAGDRRVSTPGSSNTDPRSMNREHSHGQAGRGHTPQSNTPGHAGAASRQPGRTGRHSTVGQPSGGHTPNQHPDANPSPNANRSPRAAATGGANANRSGVSKPGTNRRGVAQSGPGATAHGQSVSTQDETAHDVSFLEQFGHPDSWGLLVMRLSLAMVFIVFGGIKIWPASPAAAVVEHTVFFLPFHEFFFVLGAWEFIVGVALLWKRTLRFAAWLFFFQMGGTLLGLVWFIEGTWYVFPIYPTAIGTYIIKNFIFLGAAMVLVIGYTGSTVREPPIDRLDNGTTKRVAKKVHWMLSTWVPRHSLTFLRGTVAILLILFGIKGMIGLGATGTLENIQFALNRLGLGLSLQAVEFIIGSLKFGSGVLLLSNDRDHMTASVVVLGAYILIGLTPMLLAPQRAFFQGWLVAPAFPTLWFLKDTVTLGAIWVIRDVDHSWDLTRTIGATRDVTQVLLTWLGLDPEEAVSGQSEAR
jgi:hypothetical protein